MTRSWTMTGMLADAGAADPERIATIVPTTGGVDRLTYAALSDRSERLAAGLDRLGVGEGDTVAVWLPNVPEWLMVEFACARIGAIVAPLNTRFGPSETAHLLRVTRPRVVVLPIGFLDLDFLGMLRTAIDAPLPSGTPTSQVASKLRHVVTVDLADIRVSGLPEPTATRRSTPVPDGCTAFTALLAGADPAPDRAEPDLPVNMFMTSGTTGAPRFALHSQRGIVNRIRTTAETTGMRSSDVMLCGLPFCGVWGLGSAMLAISQGATCVCLPLFDADVGAELVSAHRVTHMHGGDLMVQGILESPSLAQREDLALRAAYFGNFTGRPGETLIELGRERAGATLSGAYGSSEGLTFIGIWRGNEPDTLRALAGGWQIADTQVRAVDPETQEVLDHEVRGELQVRGSSVFSTYLNDPEATAAAFTSDGWFRTGDLGYTLPNGRCVFLSRLKDSLRLRGFLADPVEIEEHIATHPAVGLAQVVGVNLGDGEMAVAFVQLVDGADLTAEDVQQHCRARLANYKVPSFVAFVTTFPRVDSPNGQKVRKEALREQARALIGELR